MVTKEIVFEGIRILSIQELCYLYMKRFLGYDIKNTKP